MGVEGPQLRSASGELLLQECPRSEEHRHSTKVIHQTLESNARLFLAFRFEARFELKSEPNTLRKANASENRVEWVARTQNSCKYKRRSALSHRKDHQYLFHQLSGLLKILTPAVLYRLFEERALLVAVLNCQAQVFRFLFYVLVALVVLPLAGRMQHRAK